MSVDAKLFTASNNDITSEDFTLSFKGYISFPVIEAGGYSTLSSILSSCNLKVDCNTSNHPELEEYDSYFIQKQDFECMEIPSYVLDQYSELLDDSSDNYNYLIFQPF